LSGVKKYIERADIFKIENLELFVLSSCPEQGFVNHDTNVIFKFGLTKEECLQKILDDDNKYVQDLVKKEDEVNNRSSNNATEYYYNFNIKVTQIHSCRDLIPLTRIDKWMIFYFQIILVVYVNLDQQERFEQVETKENLYENYSKMWLEEIQKVLLA